jgi:hypothetical protein
LANFDFWAVVYFRQFFVTEVSRIFNTTFSTGTSSVLSLAKNELGYLLGDIFTKSSGHPKCWASLLTPVTSVSTSAEYEVKIDGFGDSQKSLSLIISFRRKHASKITFLCLRFSTVLEKNPDVCLQTHFWEKCPMQLEQKAFCFFTK